MSLRTSASLAARYAPVHLAEPADPQAVFHLVGGDAECDELGPTDDPALAVREPRDYLIHRTMCTLSVT